MELNQENIEMAKDKIRAISEAFVRDPIDIKSIYQRKKFYGNRIAFERQIVFRFVWAKFVYKENSSTGYISIRNLETGELIADNE